MLAHVHTETFLCPFGAQRHEQADELEKREGADAAVDDGRRHRGRLDAELRRIAEEQAVDASVPRLLGQHTGQQRADHPADAVRGDHVERVVKPRAGAPHETVVTGHCGHRSEQ